jgi:hypothetical protein
MREESDDLSRHFEVPAEMPKAGRRPAVAQAPRGELGDILKRISRALTTGETAPLALAHEVVAISRTWDRYAVEMKGQSANAVFKEWLGHGVGWFEARARAVDVLGRDVATWLSHRVAVRLVADDISEEQRKAAKDDLLRMFAKKRKRGLAVTSTDARDTLRIHCPSPPSVTVDWRAECRRLRAILAANGIDPDV